MKKIVKYEVRTMKDEENMKDAVKHSYFGVRTLYLSIIRPSLFVLRTSLLIMMMLWLSGSGMAVTRKAYLTPDVETAIDKGLAWLAAQQQPDGRIVDREGNAPYPVGETAISVMAFLTNGHQPGKGLYGKVVEKALTFMVDKGRNSSNGIISSGPRSIYEHAFAVTVLAEVFGEWKRKDLKDILEDASDVLLRSQLPGGGFPYDLGLEVVTDETCAATAILALRALRDALFAIPDEAPKKAIRYLKSLANPDGSFVYSGSLRTVPGADPKDESVMRTAVGVLAIWAMGQPEAPEVKRGIAYLAKRPRLHPLWPCYGAYYQVRAMYQIGGATWEAWYPIFQPVLLQRQNPDGSFGAGEAKAMQGGSSRGLDTGFAVTALSLQKGLLPLFER